MYIDNVLIVAQGITVRVINGKNLTKRSGAQMWNRERRGMESLPIDERRKYFGSMILGLVSELDEGVRDEVARLGGMVLRYYGDEVVVNREQLAEQIENGVEELGKRMPEAADVIKHAVGAFFEFEED